LNPDAVDLPLKDIHLPDPISWWPLAIGWWIVLALSIFVGVIAFLLIKKMRKPTLKKEATAKLKKIEEEFIGHENAAICLKELSAFIRRVVISKHHSAGVAGLTGIAWLEFLDRSLDQPEFSQGIGKLLLSGPYQPQSNKEDVSHLIQLCHKWVERL
jgi:hypothetical protein